MTLIKVMKRLLFDCSTANAMVFQSYLQLQSTKNNWQVNTLQWQMCQFFIILFHFSNCEKKTFSKKNMKGGTLRRNRWKRVPALIRFFLVPFIHSVSCCWGKNGLCCGSLLPFSTESFSSVLLSLLLSLMHLCIFWCNIFFLVHSQVLSRSRLSHFWAFSFSLSLFLFLFNSIFLSSARFVSLMFLYFFCLPLWCSLFLYFPISLPLSCQLFRGTFQLFLSHLTLTLSDSIHLQSISIISNKTSRSSFLVSDAVLFLIFSRYLSFVSAFQFVLLLIFRSVG